MNVSETWFGYDSNVMEEAVSDDVRCDHCKKPGRRPRFRYAPAGWLYLEAKDDENPRGSVIVWACSVKCAQAQWKPGPGGRIDG